MQTLRKAHWPATTNHNLTNRFSAILAHCHAVSNLATLNQSIKVHKESIIEWNRFVNLNSIATGQTKLHIKKISRWGTVQLGIYTRQLIALAMLCSVGFTHASQLTFSRGAKDESDTIKIQGDFQIGDDEKFRSIALISRKATVVLNSRGGKLQPALEIGKMIRLKGFSTAVQDATCASACALVWMAGIPRIMSNFTSIGFHTAFRKDKDGAETSTPSDGAIIGAYLTSLGFSEKVVIFVVSASAREMHWLQKSTADRLGIAVNVQSTLEAPTFLRDFSEGLRARAAVPQDDSRAASLYLKSAEVGYAGAQNNLGDMYELGHGVLKNNKLAMYWYTRAAERGEPTAYLSIASFLAAGNEDPEASVEAAKFAALAFTYLPDGKNREKAENLTKTLSLKLSQFDKTRVLNLVNQWAPLFQEEHLMGDAPAAK